MSGAGSGYDLNSSTFSPDGRLFQVEYATKAVEKESLAVSVRCSDGVLFAVEKNLASPLLTPSSNSRVFWIDQHIACAAVGYRPDCYAAVVKARNEAERYLATFGVKISVQELVSRLSETFHGSHAWMGIRPYASTLMFGSLDGPTLYALEPNGQYFGYSGCCFGKGSSLARVEMQRNDWSNLTVKEAIHHVAEIIRGLHETQSHKKWEIELMWICSESQGRPEKVPQSVFAAPQK